MNNHQKLKLLPKSKCVTKQKKIHKPLILQQMIFKKYITKDGKTKYIRTNTLKGNNERENIKNNKDNNSIEINLGKNVIDSSDIKHVINNLSKSTRQDDINHRDNILNNLKQYYKTVNIPEDFTLNDTNGTNSSTSKIKIRKTNKSLITATNPSCFDDNNINIKYCLGTIPLNEIHPSKFIMLEIGTCYDIELLVNYVINRYQSHENYNIEPEFQMDPIWKSQSDIKKILNHPLIKNPGKLKSSDYLYAKNTFIENVSIFTQIINEYDINKPYFDLFDEYPQFLLGINRLGTIFHIEQPTSYFNLDTISFKDIDELDDEIINIIIDKLTNIIKLEHMDKLTQLEIKDISSLVIKINNIITQHEFVYFSQLMEDLNIVLTEQQLEQIIQNIAYMLAFHINFNEGSKAKITFINYINDMDTKNKDIALSLVNDILVSDDCIHRQGNKLRYVFIKWWYKYLNYYDISNTEISKNYVPITFGTEINKTNIISSPLLDKYQESTHGYYPVKCPHKKVPALYYKMGNISKWDGVNLNTYTFCCRLNNSPYK